MCDQAKSCSKHGIPYQPLWKQFVPLSFSLLIVWNSYRSSDYILAIVWQSCMKMYSLQCQVLIKMFINCFSFESKAPTITCLYVAKNQSDTISFDRPVLKNFPPEEMVVISYYLQNGDWKGSFPATISQHILHGFNVGTTVVTAKAYSHNIFASCDFIYYRVPGMFCSRLIQ